MLLLLETFDLVMDTTCGYQFVRTRLGMMHLDVEVEVLQAFLNYGLGMTCRVFDHWTHILSAGNFTHCTCVPTFVTGNIVSFRSHPCVVAAAWGARESTNGQGEENSRKR